MLILLHGAKKNVGDFLIRDRGLKLLAKLRPTQRVVSMERWRPLEREPLEHSDAIVLCGGPGLQQDFYPATFPLTPDLEAVTTPILPLALGWSGKPIGHPERFRFDETSRMALLAIHDRIGWSSVRDDLSLQVVQSAGVKNVRRSGCTAWYHLPSLGKTPKPPQRMRTVVFTPPANSLRLFTESAKVMWLLQHRYGSAQRYCVFHRGLSTDAETTRKEMAVVRAMACVARALGFVVIDAAFDLSQIEFYGGADLHVGYRVHAHLCFLSQRRPSLLISEDGRGIGQALALQDPYCFRAGQTELAEALDAALSAEEREGHPTLLRAVDEIERTWPVMRETIEQLPT